jgi:hypothetical protein
MRNYQTETHTAGYNATVVITVVKSSRGHATEAMSSFGFFTSTFQLTLTQRRRKAPSDNKKKGRKTFFLFHFSSAVEMLERLSSA